MGQTEDGWVGRWIGKVIRVSRKGGRSQLVSCGAKRQGMGNAWENQKGF